MYKNNERNISIDILKCIACICMVALHTQRNINEGIVYNPILYYFSRLAIPIFFMCSGYLIFMKSEYLLENKNYKEYFFIKIIGIIKIVVVWSIINSCIYYILENRLYNPLVMAIKSICNAGKLGYYWYFGALGIIYFIMFLFYPWINKHIKGSVIFCLIISFIIAMISWYNIFFNNGYFIQSYIRQTFRIWTWLFYVFIGGIFSKYEVTINKLILMISTLVLTVFIIVYQYIIFVIYLNRINSEYMYDDPIFILWIITLFSLIISLKYKLSKRGIIDKIIIIFSNNTMGIYLIHYIIISICKFENKCNSSAYAFIGYLMITLVSYIISIIINKNKITKKILKF